jgi:hypothetical protein
MAAITGRLGLTATEQARAVATLAITFGMLRATSMRNPLLQVDVGTDTSGRLVFQAAATQEHKEPDCDGKGVHEKSPFASPLGACVSLGVSLAQRCAEPKICPLL